MPPDTKINLSNFYGLINLPAITEKINTVMVMNDMPVASFISAHALNGITRSTTTRDIGGALRNNTDTVIKMKYKKWQKHVVNVEILSPAPPNWSASQDKRRSNLFSKSSIAWKNNEKLCVGCSKRD